MTLVAATSTAMYFGSLHAQASVFPFYDGFRKGFPETGPSGVAIKFGFR
jgi:hypothetical protein